MLIQEDILGGKLFLFFIDQCPNGVVHGDLSPFYEQVKSRDFVVVAGSVEAVENGFCVP